MNFQTCRENMVDSQISPMGVVDQRILDAFLNIPRENFVPEGQEGIAYCDEDLGIGGGRFLMEPACYARLLEAAQIKQDDVALVIGSALGYGAAILSSLASTVLAIEENETLLKSAEERWKALGLDNIAGFKAPLSSGLEKNAPYNVIIFEGGVSSIPSHILEQLDIGGRALAVIYENFGDACGKATRVERTSQTDFSKRVLFDASVPCLEGFEPRKQFIF